MRWMLALLMVMPLPAFAADYVNARYGYSIDVPDGFAGQGESDNGDGQVFKTPTARLTVHLPSSFGPLSLFTWTCNPPAEIEYARAHGAKVVLTDGDFANLYAKAVQ